MEATGTRPAAYHSYNHWEIVALLAEASLASKEKKKKTMLIKCVLSNECSYIKWSMAPRASVVFFCCPVLCRWCGVGIEINIIIIDLWSSLNCNYFLRNHAARFLCGSISLVTCHHHPPESFFSTHRIPDITGIVLGLAKVSPCHSSRPNYSGRYGWTVMS